MDDLEILRKAISKKHPCDPCHEALNRVSLREDELRLELAHLVQLLEPMEQEDAYSLAHEVWAAAQLVPGEGIEDGVARIARLLSPIQNRLAELEIKLSSIQKYARDRKMKTLEKIVVE